MKLVDSRGEVLVRQKWVVGVLTLILLASCGEVQDSAVPLHTPAPDSLTWAHITSTPTWTLTAPLVGCHAKALHQAVRLKNGHVLAVGGYNTNTDIYDPAAGTWSATGSPAFARRYHTATLLPSGKVLIAGGANGRFDTSAEVYDPASGTWARTGSMSYARRYHTATLLPSGKVLVAGGASSATAELYDPTTGLWEPTGSLHHARSQHTAILLLGGQVLVMGGTATSGQALAQTELYDPVSGTWMVVGSMVQARRYHTATLLPSGKVLVAGGEGAQAIATSAEIYDPSARTWSTTGSMVQPRRYHTATLLLSGKILVAGGYHGYTGIHTSAEVYDSATGTWSATATMNVERYHHTATLLVDGRVLAVGGFSNGDQGSAELHDERNGSGCADGTREGFTDLQAYPNIAACAGTFTGWIDETPADSICSLGWHVCRGNDTIVGTVTYHLANSFPGCFAFDASHDCNACYARCRQLGTIRCTVQNYEWDADMAGMGQGCLGQRNTTSTRESCLATGRLDASTNTFGCGWHPSLTGVVCCRD